MPKELQLVPGGRWICYTCGESIINSCMSHKTHPNDPYYCPQCWIKDHKKNRMHFTERGLTHVLLEVSD